MEKKISYPTEGHNNCFAIEDNSFWFRIRNKLIAFFIQKYTSKTKSFFDVGGGNGYVSRMLQDDLLLDVTMIEPGQDGCLNAHKRGVRKIINSVISDLDSSVELTSVGLFDVIEHINNAKIFLESIAKKQKKGSYIFLTVPSYNFLWSDEDLSAGHIKRYTPFDISSELKSVGYEIKEIVPFFFILIFPILLFRAIPYRIGLRTNSSLNSDHTSNCILIKLISFFLELELSFLQKGGRLPCGASLFVVAVKKSE